MFLGEFQPDAQYPGKNLWDEDMELQYRAPPGNISQAKPALYPLITRRQKKLQFNDKIYDPSNAFSDESIKIIAEEEPEEAAKSNRKGDKGKSRPKKEKESVTLLATPQPILANPPIDKTAFLPSHYNYVERFKKLEAEVEQNFFSFLDS